MERVKEVHKLRAELKLARKEGNTEEIKRIVSRLKAINPDDYFTSSRMGIEYIK